MANNSFQIAKFYAKLHELKDLIDIELIPLALNIGANQADKKLFESLEILATDIGEHLSAHQICVISKS